MEEMSVSGWYPVINGDGAYNGNFQFNYCKGNSTFQLHFVYTGKN